MTKLTERERQEMVDERVCRIIAAFRAPGPDLDDDALIAHHLADEWACLEVAAAIVAPHFGLDGTDRAIADRLKRAAHEALKAECRRIAGMGGSQPEP